MEKAYDSLPPNKASRKGAGIMMHLTLGILRQS
jgi:hypothetical protein